MTMQTIVSLQSEVPRTSELVSVLVPCLGQLEYTRLCVPSLLQRTRLPFELIVLDLGSLDGTAEYLAGLAAGVAAGQPGTTGPRLEVVRSDTDLGIPAAVKEALARARGEFLVLLNNDTVVTDGWLDQLVALANLAPQIGLVGPMSNQATPPQRVEVIPYRLSHRRLSAEGHLVGPPLDTTPVQQFAEQWRSEQRGAWMEVDRLGGFCLLIKRAVLSAVGPLPSEAGLDLFDTDTLCWKARQAGFTLALCRDLFIHHFGSRTFAHGGSAAEGR